MNSSLNPSSIRSKTEITNALLTLMAKYPYAEITVKQVILETTLVRKTFYRNFASKDDVLDSYIESILKQYINEVTEPNADLFEVIFKFCLQYKELLRLLSQNDIMYRFLLKLNEFIPMAHDKLIEEKVSVPVPFGDLDPSYLIAFNIGAVYNVIAKWVERGMTDSLDDVKKTLAQYFKNFVFSVNPQMQNHQ